MAAALPFKLSSNLNVVCWGELVDDEEYCRAAPRSTGNHSVFPVGFRSTVRHTVNGEVVTFVCEVLKGPNGPNFSVVAEAEAEEVTSGEEDSTAVSVGGSATQAFLGALAKRTDKKCSVNGMSKFGLNTDTVLKELNKLPGGAEIFAKMTAATLAKESAAAAANPPLMTRGAIKKAREEAAAVSGEEVVDTTTTADDQEKRPPSKRQKLEDGAEKATKSKPTSRAGSQVRKVGDEDETIVPEEKIMKKIPAKPRAKKATAAAGDDASARGKRNRDGVVDVDGETATVVDVDGEVKIGGEAPPPKKTPAARKPRAKKGDVDAAAPASAIDLTVGSQPLAEGDGEVAPKADKKPRAKKAPALDEEGNPVPPAPKKERKKPEPTLDENGLPVPKKERKPAATTKAAPALDSDGNPVAVTLAAEAKKEVKEKKPTAAQKKKADDAASTKQPGIAAFLQKKKGSALAAAAAAVDTDGEEEEAPKIVVLPCLDRAQRAKARSQFDKETLQTTEAAAEVGAKKNTAVVIGEGIDGADPQDPEASAPTTQKKEKTEKEIFPPEVKTKLAKRRFLSFCWSFMSEKQRMELNKKFVAANGKDATAEGVEAGKTENSKKGTTTATTTATDKKKGPAAKGGKKAPSAQPRTAKKAPSAPSSAKKKGKTISANPTPQKEAKPMEEALLVEGKVVPSSPSTPLKTEAATPAAMSPARNSTSGVKQQSTHNSVSPAATAAKPPSSSKPRASASKQRTSRAASTK